MGLWGYGVMSLKIIWIPGQARNDKRTYNLINR